MLERYIIGLILFIGFSPAGFGQVDPVQKIVERVSGDSIFYHIGRLQQMNRLAPANDRTCTQYLLETIRRYGVDSLYLQEFNADYRGTFSMGLPNIVAIRKGSLYPDSVFVLGAHYDAVNWNSDEGYTQGPCPGADDNASGTSGILEMMRLTGDWDFQKTVMFVLFGGEEFGLLGSEYFVSVETRNGTNIYAMLNFDMISHDLYEGAHCVMIINDRISRNLARTFIATLERYTPDLEYMEQETDFSLSDHNTFQDANIPAILLIDGNPWFGEINPHIHSSADTIGASANSPELAEKITKAGLATLLDTDQKGFRGQAPVYKLPLSFRAFPNPVSVFLTVEMQKSFPGSGPLCLYNSMGQLLQLWNGGKRTLQIDFSVYPEGLYLLQKEGEWVKVMKR